MTKFINAGYGAIFGSYWIIYAIVSSFSSVFLLARGYTNSQIGVTLAAANVLAVVMQPLVADIADRSKKLGVIGVTEAMTVSMMIFAVGMFAFGGGTLALCVIYVLLIGFHTVLQPLFNSLAFKLEQCGVGVNFGVARAAGSLAYSIFAAILGSLVEKHGVGIMPVTAELACFCLLGSLVFTGYWFHKKQKQNGSRTFIRQEAQKKEDDEEEINLIQFIRGNRTFFVMSLGIIGLYFSNAVLNFYTAQVVEGVGGTTEDMGRIMALSAFIEIPTMVVFNRIRRKFSCQTLLKVACIGFTVKIGLCWLADSVFMLYVAHMFQPVAFALFLPGMVYFINDVMRKGEAVKGQALYTTMITVATIFASLLGGVILDSSGPKTLAFIATIITAAGAALIIAVIDKIGGRPCTKN